MDWASPTALFQATMCRDHPGGWKCLHLRARSYLAIASIIVPAVMGPTPIQDPASHTGWALCWTTRFALIHFAAMPSQRRHASRGRRRPQPPSGASAGGHSDRWQRHSLCLQVQRFSKVVTMALAGIVTRLLSNRRKTPCRDKVVIWCLVLSSLMKACPGWLRSGGKVRGSADWIPTRPRSSAWRWTWGGRWKYIEVHPFSRHRRTISWHCKIPCSFCTFDNLIYSCLVLMCDSCCEPYFETFFCHSWASSHTGSQRTSPRRWR